MTQSAIFQAAPRPYSAPKLLFLSLSAMGKESEDTVENLIRNYLRMAEEKPGLALLAAVQSAYEILGLRSSDAVERKSSVFEKLGRGDLFGAACASIPDGFDLTVDCDRVSIRYHSCVETTEIEGEPTTQTIMLTLLNLIREIVLVDANEHASLFQGDELRTNRGMAA